MTIWKEEEIILFKHRLYVCLIETVSQLVQYAKNWFIFKRVSDFFLLSLIVKAQYNQILNSPLSEQKELIRKGHAQTLAGCLDRKEKGEKIFMGLWTLL